MNDTQKLQSMDDQTDRVNYGSLEIERASLISPQQSLNPGHLSTAMMKPQISSVISPRDFMTDNESKASKDRKVEIVASVND